MNFNAHGNLEGKHAFLSASKYHWTNYDEEKLKTVFHNFMAAQHGTEDHAFACTCIKRKQKLPRTKDTLNKYVNDAIAYRMTPEVVLYYSDNCFGTADAIYFNEQTNELRIHDLKTGETPASMKQLEIYTALFCLEYRKNPDDLAMELRIYQSEEVLCHYPEPEDIQRIMNQIIRFDRILEKEKARDAA